jgi:fatty acid desaturase
VNRFRSVTNEVGPAAPSAAVTPEEPSRGGPTCFRAPQTHLRWLERILERGLGLEHGANIFPLSHIVLYYVFLFTLAGRWVTSLWLVVPGWVALVLLNYSVTIGILHLHSHRKLFVRRLPNRLVEALLCFPCELSYPVMLYVHVYLHHRFSDGEGDPTSTTGYEKGLRAVWYWVRYPYVCHKTTIAGLFSPGARPAWKRLRVQYVVDSSVVLAVVMAYGVLDPYGMLLFYALPMVVVCFNIGFFAWLTHAPAEHGPLNGSINTTNNWMNLFIHNQGYHAVHHKQPSLHWTMLPDRLDMMTAVDDELIVPYWITLENALRILSPRRFRNARHGKAWKERYRQRVASGRHRLSFLPYFGWFS